MLSTFFNIFETTEMQLTPAAIRRLRVSSILSFFAFPCFAAAELIATSETAKIVLIVIGLICAAAMVYCFCTRLANRLWVPEKHLDEAEIERKRRSGSVTYQIMLTVLMVLAVAASLIVEGDLQVLLNPRAALYSTAAFFIGALSVQTAIAAFMTEPLSEGAVDKVPADSRYKWLLLLMVAFFGGLGFLISNLPIL